MKRRLALTAGALVAAVAFSSCTSANNGQTVAEVNGHKLTVSQLATLSSKSTDGAKLREVIKVWIHVVAQTDDDSGMTTLDELDQRSSTALQDLAATHGSAGKAAYEAAGLDNTVLCLAVIPLGADTSSDQVLSDLADGMSFADAAKKYGSSAELAAGGGVLHGPDGSDCVDVALVDENIPGLRDQLRALNAKVGTPVVLKDSGGEVLILLRPFDDLLPASQAAFAQKDLGPILQELYASADVTIDPRYGSWNAATGQVDPLSAG